MKTAVLASFNMDLMMRAERRPRPGETVQGDFAMYLGGKGFNQAVAARRLGADVAVVGRVGDDDFGRAFLDALDAEGIDRRAVTVDPAAGTGVASVLVEPDGGNTIVQAPRANRALSPDDVARAAAPFAGASAALLQLETSMPAATAFAERARAAGATVVLNPAPAATVPDELLRLADVLVPNVLEAEALLGRRVRTEEDAFAAAEELRQRGPRCIVLTMSERGAIAWDGETRLHAAAREVPVVDTVGAGDAFCAALAVRLAEGAAVAEAVRFANAAGALACTRPGAEPSMPRRREVEELLARGVRA